MSKKYIAIIAGNHRQFTHFVEHYPENKNVVFIEADFPDHVRGFRFANVVTVGTWYERADASSMQLLLDTMREVSDHE